LPPNFPSPLPRLPPLCARDSDYVPPSRSPLATAAAPPLAAAAAGGYWFFRGQASESESESVPSSYLTQRERTALADGQTLTMSAVSVRLNDGSKLDVQVSDFDGALLLLLLLLLFCAVHFNSSTRGANTPLFYPYPSSCRGDGCGPQDIDQCSASRPASNLPFEDCLQGENS
jgi:hypothetical protein